MAIILRNLLILPLLLVLGGCLDYAEYSLQAYTNATTLKAKSLALVARSGNSYASQKQAAEALMLDLAVAQEFAAGIENNNEAAQMWALIRSPDDKLVGEFVLTWRDKQPGGFGAEFRGFYREAISFAFDRLICLEVNKREPTACPEI